MGETPLAKRSLTGEGAGEDQESSSVVLKSMIEPVSPPRKKRREDKNAGNYVAVELGQKAGSGLAGAPSRPRLFKSPFQLTSIRDLPPGSNTDTVTLQDVFGDPLVAECWNFNYLHDIDFLMSGFDEDVRHLVNVHIIHGFWKQEDERRRELEEEASRYSNVRLHTAFMPEPFGTHHSKMAVLFRHDDTAQVIIHTANLIEHDWRNMAQGIWRSPLLPLTSQEDKGDGSGDAGGCNTPGSGRRFKDDLLNYLRAYNRRRPVCRLLVDKLVRYDFSAVRGALIASVPGRHPVRRMPSDEGGDAITQWGWVSLKSALQQVPVQETGPSTKIVLQISSMATLGPTDAWLRRTLFEAMARGKLNEQPLSPQRQLQQPQFRVVFPTADEIRRSLDGYESGTSIHTKIQSQQQQKQLQYMRPMLCHWANDAPNGAKVPDGPLRGEARRKRAAPHIKTYVRYGKDSIDWALLTSANLSKQAWGEAATAAGEARIASWEIGILVWPELYAEKATMQAVFGRDSVQLDTTGTNRDAAKDGGIEAQDERAIVALRIPYDLPLQRYGEEEVPWVATMPHSEEDWAGRMWPA